MNTVIEKPLENLFIIGESGAFFVPEVEFLVEAGSCSIKGESYLEDSFAFYDELIDWVNRYFKAGKTDLKVTFKLTYFNTSSSRAILDFLRNLKARQDEGRQISVVWLYAEPDLDDMKLEAEDFVDESGLKMDIVPYTEDE